MLLHLNIEFIVKFTPRLCDFPQEVLDISRTLLADMGQHTDCEIEEKKSKLEQLKTVLEM